jgi:hypothetical protein
MLIGISKGMPPIPVDISMGVTNGAAAVNMVRRAVLDLPPLLPLCLVIKALLKEAGKIRGTPLLEPLFQR